MKALFDFAGQSGLAHWMQDSQYRFPAFETLHLLGLAVLLGALFLFNMRYFGVGLTRHTIAEVSDDLAPWIQRSLLVMAGSGVPLFASKAPDLWSDDQAGFFVKMGSIAVGVMWYFAVQRRAVRAGNLAQGRLAAALSLGIWLAAALAGLSLEFL